MRYKITERFKETQYIVRDKTRRKRKTVRYWDIEGKGTQSKKKRSEMP